MHVDIDRTRKHKKSRNQKKNWEDDEASINESQDKTNVSRELWQFPTSTNPVPGSSSAEDFGPKAAAEVKVSSQPKNQTEMN